MRPLSEFDRNCPHGHVQKSGKQVRILGEIRAADYPLVVAIPSTCGASEGVAHYTADGRLLIDGQPSPHDLINAPTPKKRLQGWVNVYSGGITSDLRESREVADELARPARIACIYIDVEEGEGLS